MTIQSPKALIVLTSHNKLGNNDTPTGFWLSELTHPYFSLADNGISVDIVSINGGKAPVDPQSHNMEDNSNQRFMLDSTLAKSLENTMALSDIDPQTYQAIIFAGGHGTMWDFPDSPAVQTQAMSIYNNGGVIAAICHGPAALVNLQTSDGGYLIAGKTITAFSNEEESLAGFTQTVPFLLEDALTNRGANLAIAPAWESNLAVDKRLITGQNPQSAEAVGKKVAELLLAR